MAFHISSFDFILNNAVNNCKGIRMDEKWITRTIGVAIVRNHILFQLAEDILQHTIATGIPQHLRQYQKDFILKLEPVVEDDEPKVLTLEDLAFGFNIFLIALGISCITFVLEVVYFYIKIKMRKWLIRNIGNGVVLLNVLQWLRRYRS
jgi:hypothetical protein